MASDGLAVKLRRYDTGPLGTFGMLELPDGMMLHTLENRWLENQPFVSCVPAGEYELEPHHGSKYPDTWAAVGETVSHWAEEGKLRSVCVFHVGNWARDTQGCFLVGMERAIDRDDMISNSAEAMETLRLCLMSEDELPKLIIYDVPEPPSVEREKEMGVINLGAIFGDKPWFRSMTAWGLVLFAAVAPVVSEMGAAGLIAPELAASINGWSIKIGAVLAGLGLRRAAN